MNFGDAISLGREAIFVALMAAGPVLILSMIVGLVISLFQAVTQIQEPTLALIPKIATAGLALLFLGPFILAVLTDFMARVISGIPNFIR